MSPERKTLKIVCFLSAAAAIACVVAGCLALVSADARPQPLGIVGGVLALLAGVAAGALCVLGIRGANRPSSAGGARAAGIVAAVVGCAAAVAGVLSGSAGIAVAVTSALAGMLAIAGTVYAHRVLEQSRR